MEGKVVKEIDLDDILPNRFQPRIKFKEESLVELANSIKEHGIIQPVIVREIGDKYEIIAGERRYKASVLAGKTTIPAIINNVDDVKSTEIALIENVQRQDLTPIEEAASYKKILEMGNLTQEQLAEKVDKKQSTISNKLRLLNLADEVQEALLNEQISERHARSLLKLKENQEQVDMLERIVNERLTVRQADLEIDKAGNNESADEEFLEEIEIEDVPPIEKSPDYDYNEVKSNPGFLDIDEIERSAQDINVEPLQNNLDAILAEEETNYDQEMVDGLKEQGIEVEFNESQEEQPTGKFFNFSPGELIEKEETEVPPAPTQSARELTGFDFKYKGEQPEEVPQKKENVPQKIQEFVQGLKDSGIKLEMEEIDLEDQHQFIIKLKKD